MPTQDDNIVKHMSTAEDNLVDIFTNPRINTDLLFFLICHPLDYVLNYI